MGDQNLSGSSAELQDVEKEFRREVAITQARPLLHRTLFLLWIVFDVVLVALLVLVVGWYLIAGQWGDRASMAGLLENVSSIHSAAEQNAAASIFVNEAMALRSGDVYDFYVELENPNEDWYASFDYAFTSSAGTTETYHGFILPQETRAFIALNEAFDASPTNVEVNVTDLKWQRINAHSVSDYVAWYEDHSDFQISDAEHTTVTVGEQSIVRSSFTITNNTPYSYWSAPFLIILERNSIPVGVNQVSVAGFETGEVRDIDVNWFDNTPSSGDLVIQPAINFVDEDVYMAERSDTGVDIRDIEFE